MAWAEPVAVAQPELVERGARAQGRASQPVQAWLPVELVFSRAQQVSRQAFQQFVQQAARQALQAQEEPHVPVQVGHDLVVRLPEPVAQPEQHEQELPQRSVCLAGLAWSPQQRPDARD